MRRPIVLTILIFTGWSLSGAAGWTTVPRWNAGVSLADAKLSAQLRRRIEKVVLSDNLITDKSVREGVEQNARVLRVRLGPEGRQGLRVWGGDVNLCGKSNCSFWIFDLRDGSMLFAGNGYEIDLRSTLHHGLYDIKTTHQLGATSGEYDYYQFDGQRYVCVKTLIYGS